MSYLLLFIIIIKRLYRSSGKGKEIRCLVFTSPTKREIRQCHVLVMQWRQRNVQKSVMHVQTCCFANLNLFPFCRSRWRRRRRCLSSLLFSITGSYMYQNGERGRGTGKRNMKQRIENKVTDRAWVQLRFCSHFFIFSFPVLVPHSPFPVLVTSFSNAQTKEALSEWQNGSLWSSAGPT